MLKEFPARGQSHRFGRIAGPKRFFPRPRSPHFSPFHAERTFSTDRAHRRVSFPLTPPLHLPICPLSRALPLISGSLAVANGPMAEKTVAAIRMRNVRLENKPRRSPRDGGSSVRFKGTLSFHLIDSETECFVKEYRWNVYTHVYSSLLLLDRRKRKKIFKTHLKIEIKPIIKPYLFFIKRSKLNKYIFEITLFTND